MNSQFPFDKNGNYDDDNSNENSELHVPKKRLVGKDLYERKKKKNEIFDMKDKMKQLELENGRLKKEIDFLKKKLNETQNVENSRLSKIHIELNSIVKKPKNNREYSDDLLRLSFLLYRLSSSSYELLCKYLPFPSHSKIYKCIQTKLPLIIDGLKNDKPLLIPHPTIKKCISSQISMPIVLGIDALCVVATSKYNRIPIKNLYSFTIYIQPFSIEDKCLPIRIIEKENGIGNSEIVDLLAETSGVLKTYGFNVKFNSYDGDRCYNTPHKLFFDLYENFLLEDDLEGAINKVKDRTDIPIGDYLHIFKNQRTRFRKCNIALDKNGEFAFSIEDLKDSLGHNNKYLNDDSFLSTMRDSLALELFDMMNVLFLFQKENIVLAMALLPMSLFHFAMRSQNVPLYSRVYALCLSLWLLYFYLLNAQLRDKKIIGLNKKSGKRFCSFFSEIGLKRTINSIMAILIALNMDYDSLCLDRFGTHCLELFFGLIRGFSKGVDGWDRFYSTVGKTIMAQEALEKLGIAPNIKHRMNLAGVIITDHLQKEQFSEIYSNTNIMAKELFKYLYSSDYIMKNEMIISFER